MIKMEDLNYLMQRSFLNLKMEELIGEKTKLGEELNLKIQKAAKYLLTEI